MKTIIVLAMVMICATVEAARILGIIPIPSYSHQIPYQPIFKELSLRGHQVTVITSHPQNNPALTNLTEIDMSYSNGLLLKNLNFPDLANKTFLSFIFFRVNFTMALMENILTNPQVKNLIQDKSAHFDLAIMEAVDPAAFAFAEHFQCPFIGTSPVDASNRNYRITGNPTHPIMYPHILSVSVNLSFWERLILVLIDYLESIVYNYLLIPNQQKLVERYFGENFPKLEEIEKKMSLLYVNTDLILQTRRPVLPNVIRVGGGLHIKPSKPLPQEFQDLLDKATQGAIYFSLGSNVKSKDLSKENMNLILKTFSELPYLVFWKFEVDGLLEMPKNVITSKWFPQQDILRHPNVVLFITQGGLQSVEEAVHSHVPMVVIPFLGDQPRNARVIVDRGIGVELNIKTLTMESFKSSLLEVIENPMYRDKVKKVSQLITDEPMTGLERAVWWAEYVIRHKGAHHLKANEIPTYQYYLLDVIGFCFAVFLTVAVFFVKVSKLLFKVLKKFCMTQKVKTQ